MRQKGLSVKELAERADITRTTARTYFHDITYRVDLEILGRIATALEVRPIELFEEYETHEKAGADSTGSEEDRLTPALAVA
jgi:transcriptional regulator with XRE-family HTH domain